ncbi:EamA family transporter [Romboutsia lituseburensis]|uniref:Transporter family protein n=1 Tax=Romboutsia lituseburensis DSM 797 TaxID=1121325 RepID=A0A1G9JBU6_9FIRM|nr:EamA family transporter [Romboutsia lituseburensis]CEH33546.1 Drug/metabolite transporter [Romboutsia lituseburensis]SDL35010.1 transporter family protein [Romboutsia lituseburensis DSM 797]
MSNWLFYAVLAAISASFVTVFTKLGIKNLSPSMATTLRAIIMALFLMIVSFVKGDLNNISSVIEHKKDLLFLVFAGISGALSWLFLNIALKTGKTWQVAPIDKLSVVLTVIISVLIFKEQISTKGIVGVVFIGMGTILVALA